jgi:hypothetical protein
VHDQAGVRETSFSKERGWRMEESEAKLGSSCSSGDSTFVVQVSGYTIQSLMKHGWSVRTQAVRTQAV